MVYKVWKTSLTRSFSGSNGGVRLLLGEVGPAFLMLKIV